MSLLSMRKTMKNYLPMAVWGFVIIFALGAFMSFNPMTNRGDSRGSAAAGGDFAKINGQPVTMARFQRELNQEEGYFQMMSGQTGIGLSQRAEIPRYSWERLLEEFATAQAAKENGVNVSEGDARKEMETQIEEQVKRVGEGGTKADQDYVREQLRRNADVESIRRNLAGQKLREKLTAEARPVEVKVAHILIKTGGKLSESAARTVAEGLAGQARSGADFAKLAQTRSEDEGSKVLGGVVGWASAMPPPRPSDPKAKPDPNAAQNFDPAFTAAALRLKPNQISPPVRSQFGYHIIKALEERTYKPAAPKPAPKPAGKDDPKPDPLADYKQAAGSAIANGIIQDYKSRAVVEAKSGLLRGQLAEKAAETAMMAAVQGGKPPKMGEGLGPAVAAYEEAFAKNEPGADEALAYHLAQLYTRMDQHKKAADLLEKYASRSDPELQMLRGDTQLKLKDKTKALAAYQEALKFANANTMVLNQLAGKFKEVGHPELAKKATEQEQMITARQEQRRRQAEAEQAAAAKASAKPKDGDVVGEVTVKTDAQGKPHVVDVKKPGDAKADEKTPEKTPEKVPEKAEGKPLVVDVKKPVEAKPEEKTPATPAETKPPGK